MSMTARMWETMTRPERIVAMSLAVGGTVAIVNSTIWAIAASYMVHQKMRVARAQAQAQPTAPAFPPGTVPTRPLAATVPGADAGLPAGVR